MYETLPEYVKENARFCLWRYENRNGKKTKVPYRTDDKRADSTKTSDFAPFADVLTALGNGRYDGIGMMVYGDLSAVDIDDCVENGTLSDMAKDIVDTLDSYTEYSPSGKGIRIIVRTGSLKYDKERYYINNRKRGLEVYIAGCTAKFVTLTGNGIRERDAEERSAEVITVAAKYMLRPAMMKPSVKPPGSFLSDDSVIEIASTAINGDKFRKLWSGDTTGYISHSEAEMALCSILAFYCGGDIEQMDRLIRCSEMYREKWERNDYREDTLRKAVLRCSDFYRPINVSSATADFNETAEKLKQLNILDNDRYSDNDIGFGRLFADVFKGIARYAEERKKWFVYDGDRWTADSAGLRIAELGKDLADALFVYAAGLQDEHDRKKLLDWCKKWTPRRCRDIYIREAQSVYPLSMSEFDRDPFLFNCANCTVDIRTGKPHEHTAEDYITKITPVMYIPGIRSARWERFVDEIMSFDFGKARFLQKTLGYGLTGDTRFECMFFYYGETTRNGKGTLVESILPVMGEYGLTVRPETIAQKNRVDSHAPSEDIARLTGIRFANISEPSRGMLLNAAQVKSMTGNDTLNARYLNENSFDFKPQFKLYVNTNYLPAINDMTLFTSGRIVIIPFDRHFEESEQDKGLKKEFSEPEVQSAILNWLIDGYRMLCEEGFTQPTSVTEAIRAYGHDSDKTQQFMEDRLTEDPTEEVRTASVYEAYRIWCGENGCYTESCRTFMQELRKAGQVMRKRPKDGGEKTTVLVGFKLNGHPDFLK